MNQIPDWGVIHDEKAINNPGYVASMHPKQGGKEVVKLLGSVLAGTSDIFEVGVGPGMNAIYLAQNGYNVVAQDVSPVMGEIFREHTRENSVNVPLVICPAQDYVPDRMYDAFVCTSVLHFMPPEDALKTIGMMQNYTKPGGYHALEIFTSGTRYARNDRFYITPDELKNIYQGWDVCDQEIWTDMNAEGHEHIKFSLLLRKPFSKD